MGGLCSTGPAQSAPPGRLEGLSRNGAGDSKRSSSILGPPRLAPRPEHLWVAARHGDSLNPRRIAQVLAGADAGYVAAWHDLLNEIRQKDGDLQSMLGTREESPLSRGWTVSAVQEPGQRVASFKAKRNADYCRSALDNIRDFNAALSHLQDARYKAFSACETEWTKNRRGDVVPIKLHPLQGRRFFVTADNRVELYEDGRQQPPLDVMGKAPWRFVLHKPRTNGDTLAREGLGRCLVWFSAFSTWSLRDWLLFAELFGKPWRIASYEGVNFDDDKDNIVREILDNMTASTYAIVPEGIKIEVAWPQSPGGQTSSPSSGILQFCRSAKALVILGQQATTGDVQAGLGGSGDARHEVRLDLEAADDRALSETIRWGLLGPLVWLKYGPSEIPPKFSLNVSEALDIKAWLESAGLAKNLGVPLSRTQVYDVTGFHAPLNEEDTLGAAPSAKPTEGDTTSADAEDPAPADKVDENP